MENQGWHGQTYEVERYDPELLRAVFGGEGPATAGGDPDDDASEWDGEPWAGSLCHGVLGDPASSTNRQGSNSQSVGLDGREDTADWGWLVEFSEDKLKELKAKLSAAQKAAQSGDVKGSLVRIGCVQCLVKPAGGRVGLYFHWIVEGLGVRLAIMDREKPFGETPNVRVHVGSVRLLHEPLDRVWAQTKLLVEEMGGKVVGEKLSRVDACLDMVGVGVKEFVDPFVSGRSIRRGRKCGVYLDGLAWTGFHVGSGAIRLRIYDKVAECKGDAVKWDLMVARVYGGEVPEVASRVEFQLRRKVLKELEVETVADWISKRGAILEYLVTEWFRLTDEEVDRDNSSRFGPSRLWGRVCEGFSTWAGPAFIAAVRTRVKRSSMDIEGLVRQGIGCFTSAAARRGASIQAWSDVSRVLLDYWESFSDYLGPSVVGRYQEKRATCDASLCLGG